MTKIYYKEIFPTAPNQKMGYCVTEFVPGKKVVFKCLDLYDSPYAGEMIINGLLM